MLKGSPLGIHRTTTATPILLRRIMPALPLAMVVLLWMAPSTTAACMKLTVLMRVI
jgi:hypothetical protein